MSLGRVCCVTRTGSLSLSATRQQQLMEMIRKNPEFLRGMRQQLTGVFDEMLEKRGIPKVRAACSGYAIVRAQASTVKRATNSERVVILLELVFSTY